MMLIQKVFTDMYWILWDQNKDTNTTQYKFPMTFLTVYYNEECYMKISHSI
jgi:hypothetical protein